MGWGWSGSGWVTLPDGGDGWRNSAAACRAQLRSSAFHTSNLERDSRCSLYLRTDYGARTSMLGRVEPLDDSEESAELVAAFARKHGQVRITPPEGTESGCFHSLLELAP
jgi:hypothetical protein